MTLPGHTQVFRTPDLSTLGSTSGPPRGRFLPGFLRLPVIRGIFLAGCLQPLIYYIGFRAALLCVGPVQVAFVEFQPI